MVAKVKPTTTGKRKRGGRKEKSSNAPAELAPASERTYVKQPAPWVLGFGTTMSKCEALEELKRRMCSIKTPTGYGRNLLHCFQKSKTETISGLKSHDHYHLLTDLWPVVSKGLIDKDVHQAICDLAELMRWVCSKEIVEAEITPMKKKCVEVMCILERELPTTFFSSQAHVVLHLVDEVELCGPVGYRWMFFLERHMKVLKNMVRQKAKPEGSIAMGYLAYEAMFYCSEFVGSLHAEASEMWTNKEKAICTGQALQEKAKKVMLHEVERMQIRRGVAEHHEALQEWRIMYGSITNVKKSRFLEWISAHVAEARQHGHEVAVFGHEVLAIIEGPAWPALEYNRMWAYGNHIRTVECDMGKNTNDSVYMVDFMVDCISHKGDDDPIEAEISYVGKVEKIVQVDYGMELKTVIKMSWFMTAMNANRTGMKKDVSGMCMVNNNAMMLAHRIGDKPYVVVSNKLQQVFLYDVPNTQWKLVIGSRARARRVVHDYDEE